MLPRSPGPYARVADGSRLTWAHKGHTRPANEHAALSASQSSQQFGNHLGQRDERKLSKSFSKASI